MSVISIGGIEQYGGLYSPYKAMDIPTVDIETIKKQNQQKLSDLTASSDNALTNGQKDTQGFNVDNKDSSQTVDLPSKTAKLEDISLTFNQNDQFDYIGQDSNVFSLDVEQAISNMKKDSVLQEYQYFVGSSKNMFEPTQSEDGIVIPKFY